MKETLNPIPGDRDCRINSYVDRHERYLREAKESESEILFIGDSLIEHLLQTEIWDQFSQMHALNFGISGDKTQNIIWRIKNGELDFEDNKPKAVILLIGTNNTEEVEDIVEGILSIVKLINKKLPTSYVIVLALFPKGANPCTERTKVEQINASLSQALARWTNALVRFVDLDPGFVQPDGKINHHDMYDYLHLTKRGYEKAFGPLVKILSTLLYEETGGPTEETGP